MIRFFFFSILFCFPFVLFGQKYSFVTYSTEKGLPQSQVTAINQDDEGYLWVGTLGGLAKFNGRHFFSISTSDGLLNNRIKSIDYLKDTLWIGHDGGVSFISNDQIGSIAFTGNGNDQSRNVSKIIRFKNKIYVCSNGGGLFKRVNHQLIKVELNGVDFDRIRSAVVYNDSLYLATRGGILISGDGVHFKRWNHFGEISCSGIFLRGNKMVYSSYTNGIEILDLSSNKVERIPGSDLKYSIYNCYIDLNGVVWLSTLNGLIHINQANKPVFLDDSNGLPVNMISCYFNDAEGNFWIGSQGKGVFRYPGMNFKYYDQSSGFPSDLIITGFQDSNGDYYFGTFDKGIIKKTKKGSSIILNSIEETIWASTFDVDNKKWFGSGSSLIEMDENDRLTYHRMENNPAIPGTKITALYRINNETMLIGGNYGVSIYKNGVFEKLGDNSIESQEIGTVRDFEIVNDSIYAVTNLGILIFRDSNFVNLKDVNELVYCIEKSEDGTIYYGAEEGLFSYKDGVFKRIEILKDPASNYIDFLNYKDGELFVGTNNGLFILNNLKSKDIKINRFGIEEGIIDLETNLNSGFFDNASNFWFGTSSGLMCYHKTEVKQKKGKPKIVLQSILVNYEDFEYSKYSSSASNYVLPTDLSLPYNKNNIIFEIDGVFLRNSEGLKYQFWLEGLRDSWSALSTNSVISFSNLPSGEYQLHIRSVDLEMNTSDEIIFPFSIQSAFYKTWWFYGVITFFVIGLFFLFFRIRLRRIAEIIEKDKLMYRSRLLTLEQQSMNASMNRHFIFNSLNSIQYFINTQDRLSANKFLTNFAKLIRKNLDSATSPDNIISLEDEVERIQLYLSLEAMRFKDRFEYVIDVKNVDTESVFIPAMIMQPFIENSIIHGILPDDTRKGKIEIVIEIINGYLEISIEDNGVGVEHSMSNKNKSLGDHKSQGMEITSKRIELIQKISENDISLIGPFEVRNKDGSIKGTKVLLKIPCDNLVDK